MNLLLQLPAPQIPAIPFFSQTYVLDGVTYTLQFEWNDRDLGWYVEVYDEPGQVLLMGQCRLVGDWFCYLAQTVRFPPGLLRVRDTTGQGESPTLEGLGARFQLYYTDHATTLALGLG